MRIYLSLLVVVCALCCVSATQLKYDWYLQNASSPKPLARYHHAASAVGNNTDFIVVVGGFDFVGAGEFLNDTWVYHTRNNTWRFFNSSLSTNLTTRAYFTADAYRHEVIAYAGLGPNGTVNNDVWRFVNFSWHKDTYHPNVSASTQLLLKKQNHASAVIGDTLYVFGGYSGYYGNNTNELFAYNLTTHNWTLLYSSWTNGPAARQGHTLHAWRDPVWGDSLIVFGGYSDKPYVAGMNDAWQYVLKDSKWYSLNNVGAPDARWGHAGAITGNTLYIQGGFKFSTPQDTYYGDTNGLTLNGAGASKWVQVTADVTSGINKRQGHEIVNVNGTLYSTAGYVQYVGLDNSVWAFNDK